MHKGCGIVSMTAWSRSAPLLMSLARLAPACQAHQPVSMSQEALGWCVIVAIMRCRQSLGMLDADVARDAVSCPVATMRQPALPRKHLGVQLCRLSR